MKNIIRFFGIIAITAIAGLSMVSCDMKGGTFELVNGTGGTIYYSFSTSNSVNSVSYALSDGSKATLELSEDGKVYYAWATSQYSLFVHTGVEDIA
ncbi:MAG TPA: hypothetical protein DEQ14_04275, partial [Treponema sp.]|nr:hypothetical protein [Treponema sp.]